MDYTKLNEKEILEWLKKNLSEKRYIHSVGTAQCAKELAKQFNLDENKAYWAGLLHDCAKCFDKEKLLEIINENLNVNQNELMNYKTLHAPVSAHCAKNDLGICDDEILSAIRWHTLGKLEMSDFEKIIFFTITFTFTIYYAKKSNFEKEIVPNSNKSSLSKRGVPLDEKIHKKGCPS